MDRSSWTKRKVASGPFRQSFRRLGGSRAAGELDRLLPGGDSVSEDLSEFGIAAGDGARSRPLGWGVVGGVLGLGVLGLFGDRVLDEEILK